VSGDSFWPKTWKEAVPLIVWGILIFAAGFEGVATLVHGEWIPSFASFALMVGLTAMLIHHNFLRSWLLSLNPNWVVAAVLVALVLIGAAPFLDRERWPLLLVWQTIQPPSSEQPTPTPTSIRILFGDSGDAPKVLEANNTKWQFFAYDGYSSMLAPLFTNPGESPCSGDGILTSSTGSFGAGVRFCEYKFKRLNILLSFTKPVTFTKVKITSDGSAFRSGEQKAMTESYAVIAFTSYPRGTLLDIEAAE
jgi:hypothetical protein